MIGIISKPANIDLLGDWGFGYRPSPPLLFALNFAMVGATCWLAAATILCTAVDSRLRKDRKPEQTTREAAAGLPNSAAAMAHICELGSYRNRISSR